jgi:CheY-like chemotaxis protein
MAKPTILFIDDEQWLMSGIVDSLSDSYNVVKARTGDDGLKIIESGNHDIALILLDIMMPEGQIISTHDRGRTSGVKVVSILKEMGATIPIVCYTGLNDREVHEQLVELGVNTVISKRTLPSKLERVIQRVLSETSEEK